MSDDTPNVHHLLGYSHSGWESLVALIESNADIDVIRQVASSHAEQLKRLAVETGRLYAPSGRPRR